MKTAPSSTVSKSFGEWHDVALAEPVAVTRHGRVSIVMLSKGKYDAMIMHRREVTDPAEIESLGVSPR